MEYIGVDGSLQVQGDVLILRIRARGERRIALQSVTAVTLRRRGLTLWFGYPSQSEVVWFDRHHARRFDELFGWLQTVVAYNRTHGIDPSSHPIDRAAPSPGDPGSPEPTRGAVEMRDAGATGPPPSPVSSRDPLAPDASSSTAEVPDAPAIDSRSNQELPSSSHEDADDTDPAAKLSSEDRAIFDSFKRAFDRASGDGDPLRAFWAIRWGGREPGSWMPSVPEGADRVWSLLAQTPIDYGPWVVDRDLQAARSAARRRYEADLHHQRYGTEEDTYDPALISDELDQTVLLTGIYHESPSSKLHTLAMTKHYPNSDPDRWSVGELVTDGGTFSAFNIPRRFDRGRLTLVGKLGANRDDRGQWTYSLHLCVPIDSVPIAVPRWPGLTPGACASRALFCRRLIDEDQERLAPTPDLVPTLRAVYWPMSERELLLSRSLEMRALVAETLRELVGEPSHSSSGAGRDAAESTLPEPRMLKGHQDAEMYAAEVLGALGFSGVKRTPTGPDGGIDVEGDDIVAQVKMEAIPTGRDRLQALKGIAVVEGKQAAFFSLSGYTRQAIDWAERADVALFEFGYDGSVQASNRQGSDLLH